MDVEQFQHIIQIRAAIHQITAVGQLAVFLDHFIVLIPDFADQLLQNVLHGDDTEHAVVLIHHHSHVGFRLLKHFQKIGNLGVLHDERGR